jgi:type I restriction enzyme, S subunit
MSFPRYEAYKDSGVEWLGEIPPHWEVRTLKRFASFRSGEAITSESINEDGEFPVFGGNGVRGYTSSNTHEGDYVLIGRQGALCGNINYAYGKFWASEHAIVVNHNQPVPITWLGELLRAMDLNQYSASAAQPGISVEEIRELRMPLPPYQEQLAIATFLDRETAKIDALVKEQQRLIALLKEKIISLVLSHWGSNGSRELRLRDAAQVILRPVAQQDDVFYIPLGLFNRGRGLFHKEPREKNDMGDSDFYWVKEGDLIISGQFAWEGAVAMAGPEESNCVVSHRYYLLRGKPNVALAEYLFGLLLTRHGDFLLNEYSRGAAGRNRPLNIGLFLKEKISIPPMEVQQKVAEAVKQQATLIAQLAEQANILQERRSALISAAVTGKIDVRGLAPKTAEAA